MREDPLADYMDRSKQSVCTRRWPPLSDALTERELLIFSNPSVADNLRECFPGCFLNFQDERFQIAGTLSVVRQISGRLEIIRGDPSSLDAKDGYIHKKTPPFQNERKHPEPKSFYNHLLYFIICILLLSIGLIMYPLQSSESGRDMMKEPPGSIDAEIGPALTSTPSVLKLSHSEPLITQPVIVTPSSSTMASTTSTSTTSTTSTTTSTTSAPVIVPSAGKAGKPSLTLCILTMNRLSPLKRLTAALLKGQYDDQRVDLRFSVDVRGTGDNVRVDWRVAQFAKEFEWPFGEKNVTIREENRGILHQWVDACDAMQSEDDLVLILEDDLDIIPEFFHWLMNAKDYYFSCPKIAGISLNILTWIPAKKVMGFNVNNGEMPLASLLMGSWGHMPNPKFWFKFRSWVYDKRENDTTFRPFVPGLVMDDWYRDFINHGKDNGMWTIWHLRYSNDNRFYTVYPNIDSGTITTSWNDQGLHFEGGNGRFNPLALGDPALKNFGDLTYYDWEGEQVEEMRCNVGN